MAVISRAKKEWPADKVERRPLDSLIPYARNARTHSDEQVAQIAASMREWGWTNPVLIDEDGGIIAGHGRVMAARKLGFDEVPVMIARGWTEAQRRAYVIADNKLAMNAGWDDALLRTELGELQGLGFDLGLTGFADLELDTLLIEETEGLTDPDDVPEPPADPVTVLGDVWLLGRHRLVCGDSSDADVIDQALNGMTPDTTVYDPPYDESDAWGWHYRSSMAVVFFDYKRMREAAQVLNDYEHVYNFIWDGASSWYTPNRPLVRHKSCAVGMQSPYWDFDAAIYHDGKQRDSRIVRNTRGSCNYQPLPNGYVHLQTVYQSPNTKAEGGHAHAKPVNWVRAILKGAGSQNILDQFAGSGTTIIAATGEMTVAAIEIDRAMCDVIIARWEMASGLHAARA